MTEQQHIHINRKLRFKKILSVFFIIGGMGLTAMVLWPLFYATDVEMLIVETEKPPESDTTIVNTVQASSTAEAEQRPVSDTNMQTAPPASEHIQQVEPTAVVKKLSFEDKQQQTTITAERAEQNVNHTRLQSAQIASKQNTSLLQADTATIDNTTKQVDAQGNVYYRDKEGVEIMSESIRIKQDEHIKASGGVVISSDGVVAKSDTATYAEKEGILTMSGGVTIQIDQ